jgi:muramidase (phage lysozyme)
MTTPQTQATPTQTSTAPNTPSPLAPPQSLSANQLREELRETTTKTLDSLSDLAKGAFEQIAQGSKGFYLRKGSGGAQKEAVIHAQEVLLKWAEREGGTEAKALIEKVKEEQERGNLGVESERLLRMFQSSYGLDAKGNLFSTEGGKIGLAADGVLGIRTLNAMAQWLEKSAPNESITQEYSKFIYRESSGNLDAFGRLTNWQWGGRSPYESGAGDASDLDSTPVQSDLRSAKGYVAATPEQVMKRYGMTRDEAVNVIAALGVISLAEGTANEKGYNTTFGYGYFDDLTTHPNNSTAYKNTTTSAAGKYQFLKSTYDDLNAAGKMPSMRPVDQDFGAIELIRDKGRAFELIKAGRFEEALPLIAPVWASLPTRPGDTGGVYGQGAKNWNTLTNAFEQYRRGAATAEPEPERQSVPPETTTKSDNPKGNTATERSTDVLGAARRYIDSKGGFISYHSEDCVTFLTKFIESPQGLNRQLTPEQERLLKLDYSDINTNDGYRRAVQARDPRTKGIVQMLTSAGIGEEVNLQDAKPGDLLQYHYTLRDGSQAGHAAIVQGVIRDDQGKVVALQLLGSHQGTGGTGTIKVSVDRMQPAYLGRFTG